MRRIVDKLGTVYAVDAKLVAATIVYTVHASDVMVARAALHSVRGCVTDALVYREADRRRRIASALHTLIEQELGRPLRPSRSGPGLSPPTAKLGRAVDKSVPGHRQALS
jgi:hypothetical protein